MQFLFLVPLLLILCYLWVRLRSSFPGWHRWWGGALFVTALLSPFTYRLLPTHWTWTATALAVTGSFFLVFIGNWLLVCILFDAFLGIRRLAGRASRRANHATRLRWSHRYALAALLVSVFFFGVGVPHQLRFQVTRVSVPVDAPLQRPLRLALITDTHFDLLFPQSKLQALVDTLRELQPDAVLFAGDLSDVQSVVLQRRRFDSLFSEIRAPYGFWGVTGNHEAYINPEGGTMVWARNNGLRFLEDSTACTEVFCITGRNDHHYAESHAIGRKSLAELSQSALPDRPWLILDHQPRGLTSADAKSIRMPELVMSGHTHNGQFFPWNWVVRLIWKLPYGLGRLDGVPWFVSSGFGQWGPPLRVGTISEVVLVNLVPR